jgi:hypothetical protein
MNKDSINLLCLVQDLRVIVSSKSRYQLGKKILDKMKRPSFSKTDGELNFMLFQAALLRDIMYYNDHK